MARSKGSASRSKTVVRSAKTGRFVKASSAKRSSGTTIVEKVNVASHTVDVARSAATGRFVKKATARRHPDKTSVKRVKR